ncbi:MAG: hypothetical protein J6I64_06040, partial [Lachnospiraceae bacterium]|nr:hypothetical protein [Lachnospiraceae bacterium]
EIEYRPGWREEVLADVLLLRKEGLVRMGRRDWVEYMRDPAQVQYRLEDMGRFYDLAGRRSKTERVTEQLDLIDWLEAQISAPWICQWLAEERQRLTDGKLLEDEKMPGRKNLYQCLIGLDHLAQVERPMLQRVFSKRFLGNSKLFEKELKSTVISLARKFYPDIPKDKDAMPDVDVLRQLHLEVYSQELTVKGSLRFYLQSEDGTERMLDTAEYPYGVVLNQQTLDHMRLCEEQDIGLVRTIENKANFVAEPYEEGKLVVFTHGYVTPGERKLLVKLRELLDRQSDDKIAEKQQRQIVRYEHSGDLDFGGICIYRYLREKIFPQLQPLRMDVETYEACVKQGLAEGVDAAMSKKLAELSSDPQLGALAMRLSTDRMVVEQEAYL